MTLVVTTGSAWADDKAQLFVTKEDGYGRLVLSFPGRNDLPKYKITSQNGILAVVFDEPVDATLPDVSATLPDYISVARTDPDNRGVRFALRTPLNFNSIEAGEKLFIDLMPPTWQGLPPSLPPEVVAELSKRAEDAAVLAEQKRKADEARELNPVAVLRVGSNPTFMRIQFDWSVKTEGKFVQTGDTGTLRFDWPVPVDLYQLNASLPQQIRAAKNTVGPDGSTITLTLADGVKPRFYVTSDRQFVIDIDMSNGKPSGLEAAALLAKEEPGNNPDATAAVSADDAASILEGISGEVTPLVKTVGSTVRVVFPFQRDTPAAVFRRGNTLWLVFDTPASIGTPSPADGLQAIASAVSVEPSGDTQVVRMELNADRLATLGSQGKAWVLSLGDALLTPTEPLVLNRRVDQEGLFQITADLGKPGKVHEFTDPVVGDTLEVVTAYPPARGVTRDLSFVDFSTLRSVHGLVVRPTHQGVGVNIESKLAVIHSVSGLTVSPADSGRQLQIGSEATRDRFMDMQALVETDPAKFGVQEQQLMTASAAAQGKDLDNARLALAQFYIANQYGMEALGVLDVAEKGLKTTDLLKTIQLTRAVADIEAYRPQDALGILNSNAMTDDVDALMWRTIAKTEAYDYQGARTDALAAESVINDYPAWVQSRFLMSAGRAAIESNDMPLASRYISMVNVARLDPEGLSTLRLLSGRVDEAAGRTQDALDSYGQVIAADFRPSRAEAVFRTLTVLDKAGNLDLDKATASLASEALLWRGGPLEADMQKLLAELYFRHGDYRLGFQTAKEAAQFHPDSEPVEQLTAEAQGQFADLYLNGKADAIDPVKALSLFYDFRELTPPGARGDEMIRNLARRLVKVDLLAQASQLLNYQIDSRLKGVAQAQVGADLAVIDIANRDPAGALRVLTKTQMAELSPTLDRQRRTLQARALIDAGRGDLALDLLRQMNGRDIDLLRVDAHWSAKRYTQAGELLETIYAPPSNGGAMNETARTSIIKAAVGYVLAGDTIGLSRLRSKFETQMAQSPQWPMFDYITGQIETTTSAQFKQVAKEVGGLDSLNAFLASYHSVYAADGALTPPTATKADAVPPPSA
ncbi:MAG TPA: hypothetical protein VGM83_04830 [Devosiaceae bacterium]